MTTQQSVQETLQRCCNQHNLEVLHTHIRLEGHQFHLQLHQVYHHGVEPLQRRAVISGSNKIRIINLLVSTANRNLELEFPPILDQTVNSGFLPRTQEVALYLGKTYKLFYYFFLIGYKTNHVYPVINVCNFFVVQI